MEVKGRDTDKEKKDNKEVKEREVEGHLDKKKMREGRNGQIKKK